MSNDSLAHISTLDAGHAPCKLCHKAKLGSGTFLCCNDITAARLLQLLARLRIGVPDDVLMAGVDDVRIASLTTPPLTTLHQPCEDLARTAVDTLLSRIRNPNSPVRKLQLDAPLVIRASTGPKKVAKG